MRSASRPAPHRRTAGAPSSDSSARSRGRRRARCGSCHRSRRCRVIRPRVVDERVVERDVAVDHLRPKRRPPRRPHRSRTDRARLRAAHRWAGSSIASAIGRSRRRVLHVPQQHATRRRMEERPHRAAQARDRDARSRSAPRRRARSGSIERDPACTHDARTRCASPPRHRAHARRERARPARGVRAASGSGAATGRVGSDGQHVKRRGRLHVDDRRGPRSRWRSSGRPTGPSRPRITKPWSRSLPSGVAVPRRSNSVRGRPRRLLGAERRRLPRAGRLRRP